MIKKEITNHLKPIVDASGYAVFEQNKKIFFINYGISWIYTFNFVIGILLAILTINGIIQLVFNFLTGIILLAIALPCGLGLVGGVNMIKKAKNKPLENLNIIAIVDIKSKKLLKKNGEILASLGVVQFGRTFQIGSSSYAIRARWPDGSIIIARGNPFAGGISDFIYALKSRGLMK